MRVLLTNDDGVDATGLQVIRQHLMAVADQVVTVAPARDCSGFARSATFKTPVTVTRRSDGQHPVYACDGTPTDCVRLALLAGLVRDVDVVVSGINHGANIGDDVYYSGTVSAGLEASLLGVSSVCVSQDSAHTGVSWSEAAEAFVPGDFAVSAEVGAAAAAVVAGRRPLEPVVLTMNVPARPVSREVLLTRLGVRPYDHGSMAPHEGDGESQSYYLFGTGAESMPPSGEHGTDFAALQAGRISLTPLYVAPDVDHLADHQWELLSAVVAAASG